MTRYHRNPRPAWGLWLTALIATGGLVWFAVTIDWLAAR